MSNQIPVWTGNRGTIMMIKVALAQSAETPVFVSSLPELEKAVTENNVRCVVAGLGELQAAGLNPVTLAARIGKDIHYVILSVGQTAPDAPGVLLNHLRIPFSAAELRQAVESGSRNDVPRSSGERMPQGADLTSIVRAEIERIVNEKAEAMVAEAVMKMVPELAEAMIKAELERLLSEAGDNAVSTDPAPNDED